MTKVNKAWRIAQDFVAAREGGYVNDPRDPGGATKFGVSLRWLRSLGLDIDGDGDITAADIKALTPAQAESLFKAHFWDCARLDELPARVAICHYDASVNMGPGAATKRLQAVCNAYNTHPTLVVDGVLGPATRACVCTLCPTIKEVHAFCDRLLSSRESFYCSLAVCKPKFKAFLRGWLARVHALRLLIQQGPFL